MACFKQVYEGYCTESLLNYSKLWMWKNLCSHRPVIPTTEAESERAEVKGLGAFTEQFVALSEKVKRSWDISPVIELM